MNPLAHAKYRPLWIAALALLALPLVMRVFGLSLTTASMVVILAIATMGLNLLVGYTGLTSFGHGTWFGIGAVVIRRRRPRRSTRARNRPG